MASKSKQNDSATSEVKLEDESSVGVTRVEVPEDPSAEYMKEQDQALLHYKLTGDPGIYIDVSRDQEPDIAPELGVSPHPELANPAPPKVSFSAVASDSPVVAPVEEKEEAGDEGVTEALAAREEAAKDGADATELPAAPVSSAPKASDAEKP